MEKARSFQELVKEKQNSRIPHAWILAMGGVIVLAGLYLLRERLAAFDWALLGRTLAGARWDLLAAATTLVLLTYLGRALRWQLMIRPLRYVPLWTILAPTLIGFTAVVLFGRAGEMVRPYLIASRGRVSFSSQVAAWMLERILDLLFVLLLFGFALIRVEASGLQAGPNLSWLLRTGGWIIGGVCAVCLILLFILRRFDEAVQVRLLESLSFLPPAILGRVAGILRSFALGMSSTRSGSFLAGLFGYTLLEWLLIIVGFLFVFKAFPFTSGFTVTDTAIVMGFVALGSALQLPGIGGGMQIATVVVLTELFQLNLEPATGLAIMLWLISFVTVVPFGLALALREGIRWKNLREMGEAAGISAGASDAPPSSQDPS
jgi:uncharacterized membrane protein YbhN (UPF0104 family)